LQPLMHTTTTTYLGGDGWETSASTLQLLSMHSHHRIHTLLFVNSAFIIAHNIGSFSHEQPGTEPAIFPQWLNTNCLSADGCVHVVYLSPLSQQWWGDLLEWAN
jgi:hypothetical protein